MPKPSSTPCRAISTRQNATNFHLLHLARLHDPRCIPLLVELLTLAALEILRLESEAAKGRGRDDERNGNATGKATNTAAKTHSRQRCGVSRLGHGQPGQLRKG